MPSPTLTIEEVEKEFAIWRSNKKGQSTVQETLLHKVETLLKSHKYSIVLRRLGLSIQQAIREIIFRISDSSLSIISGKLGCFFTCTSLLVSYDVHNANFY